MTRTSDVKIPLEDRTAIARKAGADLFVCLHFNAFPEDKQVKGTEIYCCTPAGAYSFNSKGEGDTRWVVGNRNDEKNMLFAYQMMKSYERNLGFEDRGVKRARYQVLREATMPGILIEGGFMSNPADGRMIFDPAYRKRMAKAVVDGILAYRRITKGSNETDSNKKAE
jgi:N-acetylmuramoyl-L-alanine amidase